MKKWKQLGKFVSWQDKQFISSANLATVSFSIHRYTRGLYMYIHILWYSHYKIILLMHVLGSVVQWPFKIVYFLYFVNKSHVHIFKLSVELYMSSAVELSVVNNFHSIIQ